MTLTSIIACLAFISRQRFKSFFPACAPAVLLVAGAHCLQAGPIPKLFNTGVDESGVLLAESQLDPHYTMTASADMNLTGPDAFTLMPGFPVGPWIAEGPNSRWIAPQADQSTGNSPGTYTFTTTFDLTSHDPATAQITGRVSADNSITAVRLNGSDLGITAGGFDAFHSFTIPLGSPFSSGTNQLEFDVSNAGDTPNPIGFRVEMTGRAVGPNESPSVVTPPQSQTVIVGDIVSFTVDADGTAPLTYQWRLNGNPITGANSASYTIAGVTTNNAGDYTVAVTNFFGQDISAAATLTVWVPFPGIYNTGLGDSRAALDDGQLDPHYKLVVNPGSPASSDSLVQDSTLYPIVDGPWIQNSAKSKWIGPAFDTSTAAAGNYSYQLTLNLTGYDPGTALLAGSWATDDGGSIYLNGADTGFRSSGFATFSTFTLTNGFITGTNQLEFRVNNGSVGNTGLRVENLRGTAQEQVVAIFPPRIVTQPKGATKVITDTVTLTVVADGTPELSYQWFHDGALVIGGTSASLTLAPLTVAETGGYDVRVSNSLGSTNSEIAQLVVVQPQFGVFDTGVDASGALLEGGQPDPHYVLMSSPDLTYTGPTLYAPGVGLPIPPWVATGPNSRWITPLFNGANASPGTYQYRLFFTLSSNELATASIAGTVATDDGNGGIVLNGTRVDFEASGFTAYTDLNIPVGSPFLTGLNTLDFFVNNGGVAANPTGLRVDNLVLSGATVPPTLAVSVAGNDIRIAWLASATDLVLQETAALPGGWGDSSASVTVEGNQKVALITLTGTAKFYRLRK
jgi:Immunoglobulin domain